jgi:hypothetical protein
MPTVYVVQEPLRRDSSTGDLVRYIDLTPAREYGDIETLLPPGRLMLSPEPTVERLRDGLIHFTDDDFLLPVGDQVAIAAASAVAANINGGRFKVLKWDRQARAYLKIQVDINGER